MSPWSPVITDFWDARFVNGDVIHRADEFVLTVNPELSGERAVMLLKRSGGADMAVVTPAVAAALALDERSIRSEPGFREALRAAGISLHGGDYIHYFAEDQRRVLRSESDRPDIRQLTAEDAAAFAAFESAASEQDLDDAYVELDHWVVFGALDGGRLTCVASMYPWEGSRLADLGVLTLPTLRGRGYARDVVRAISRHALAEGYEPQYRCQLDNAASIALASAAGLTRFGTWEVVSTVSPVGAAE